MRKVLFLSNLFLLFFVFIFSCAAAPKKNAAKSASGSDDHGFSVTIHNNTIWDISILSENKDRIIASGKNETVLLPVYTGELSIPREIKCYVNITNEVTKTIMLANKIIKKEERIVYINDEYFESDDNYFVITNNSASVIKVVRPGANTIRSGIGADAGRDSANGRYELQRGETNAYIPNNFPSSVQNEQGKLFSIPQNIKNGFVNYYSFNGSELILTDIRPIYRAGEPSWAKTITAAVSPMTLISEDGQINLFYPANKEIKRVTYNSAGREVASVTCGKEKFDTKYAQKTENGFFLAGYSELSNGSFKPVARIFGENGVQVTELDVTSNQNIRSAFFNTTARKDNTSWFLSGGGDRVAGQELAYVRYVKNEGNKLSGVWELTGEDFEKTGQGSKYADVTASAYNKARDRLLVAGQVINSNSFYVAEISADGRIININKNFKDRTFAKIVTAPDGSYYLIGEEVKGDDVFAFVSKHDAAGKQLWRLNDQPRENSYYQDAVLDLENNRIILAGTMKAKETHGLGGTPFIDSLNIENGSIIWREELTDSSLKGASLVTAITHAPDYGFAITLSGVSDNYDKPFIIARINSQGKFFKE